MEKLSKKCSEIYLDHFVKVNKGRQNESRRNGSRRSGNKPFHSLFIFSKENWGIIDLSQFDRSAGMKCHYCPKFLDIL